MEFRGTPRSTHSEMNSRPDPWKLTILESGLNLSLQYFTILFIEDEARGLSFMIIAPVFV